MDYFKSIYNESPLMVIFMGVVFIGSIIFAIIKNTKYKKDASSFLEENPNAVKIYTHYKNSLFTNSNISIFTINGKKACLFTEGANTAGVYAVPGNIEIEVEFSKYESKGITGKTHVTTTTGKVKKILEVKVGRDYKIGFNEENNAFTFDEI